MAANTEFVIFLDTAMPLNDERFARSFLTAWLNHPLDKLRPERWGLGEPVRNVISEVSLDELVSAWCETPLVFSRVSKPRMKVSLDWRKKKGLDSRPFPWGLTAWIAKNGGQDSVIAFFGLVVTHFCPAFACVSTYAESRQKHFVRVPFFIKERRAGTAEEFRGHHVQDTFPGVEWITYFGREAIDRLGEANLLTLPVGRIERFSDGFLLRAYEDTSLIGTSEGRLIEKRIVSHLGSDNFFDRHTHGVSSSPIAP